MFAEYDLDVWLVHFISIAQINVICHHRLLFFIFLSVLRVG